MYIWCIIIEVSIKLLKLLFDLAYEQSTKNLNSPTTSTNTPLNRYKNVFVKENCPKTPISENPIILAYKGWWPPVSSQATTKARTHLVAPCIFSGDHQDTHTHAHTHTLVGPCWLARLPQPWCPMQLDVG
jgi:hypothetical protein